MARTPRSTDDLIAATAEHGRAIQPAVEYWEHLHNGRFVENYMMALIAAGVPGGKASEIAEVVRVETAKIAEHLSSAAYLLREICGEVADAQSRAKTASVETGFRV